MKKSIVMSIGISTAALALSTLGVSAAEKATVTASTLNVRSGPGTNYSVVGKVYKGNSVEILSSSNGWHKIKMSNGSTGWSSGQYLNTSGTSNGGTTTPSTGKKGTVTASTLNVRSGAGTNHSVIGKVYKGNSVEILSSSNGWHKIKMSNGNTGWASAQYISTSGSSNNGGGTTTTPTTGKKMTVTASTLNIRSGAGTNYSIITKVHSGNTVEVLSTSNGWSNVKTSSGKIGWASSQYLSSNTNSGTTSSKAQAIVNLAKKQLGKPYVWGAEGPNSFDCSGFVYYVYKNSGVSVPRTSVEQSKVGTTVSRSNLQPGDLVFSSTNGSGRVSHVGIYIGNGQMIHAPGSGDVVKTTNINTSYWNGAYLWSKRVI